MDLTKAIDSIVGQLKDFLGNKNAIVGLSGGIDSTVTAYLCVKAVGPQRVHGLTLPYNDQSSEDGELVAKELSLVHGRNINIGPMVDSFFPLRIDLEEEGFSKLTLGNIMARIRMVVLYQYANDYNGIVVGTTNKTEAAIGYYTKYGDGAVDVEPIADLYKTEVWQAGKILGVPKKIIHKAPSAELWEDQYDEDELGMTYEEMDQMLRVRPMMINVWKEKFGEKGMKLLDLIEMSEHKRHMPPAFKVR